MDFYSYRLRAENAPPPPTIEFWRHISYHKEKFMLCILRDVYTLYARAFVSDSLLYILSNYLEKEKFELQKEDIKLLFI